MKKYPLYQSQLGVFLECQTYPDSLQYNLPMHIVLDRTQDTAALAEAWKKLIHASVGLRARFGIDEEGNPYQWPDEQTPVEIPIRQMGEAEVREYIEDGFVRPFRVADGDEPLIRVELIETEDKLHMLMDIHHLIADGVSYSSILERELAFWLSGRERAVDLSYFEMAEEEQAYFSSPEYQEAREYFVNKLKGKEMTGLSELPLATGRRITHAEAVDKKRLRTVVRGASGGAVHVLPGRLCAGAGQAGPRG